MVSKNNSMEQVKSLVDMAPHPVFLLEFSEKFKIQHINEKFYEFFQLNEETLTERYDNSLINLIEKEKREEFSREMWIALKEKEECDMDIKLEIRPNKYELFRLNAYCIDNGEERLIYGFILSLKRRLELMEKYQEQGAYFDVAQDFSKDVLFKIDIKNKTMQHRSDRAKTFGIPAVVENFPEVLAEGDVIHPEDLEEYMIYARNMAKGIAGIHDVRIKLITGKYEKYRICSKSLNDMNGKPISILGKLVNIQEITEMEERASLDLLTQTYNKISFQEKVEQILANSKDVQKHAILFLDLDDFKGINDRLGHGFGDFLLQAVSERMRGIIRNKDFIGRVGGDEFVIFFSGCGEEQILLNRGELLLDNIRREYVSGESKATMNGSVGIAIYPEHGKTYEELYAHADLALYQSKNDGKNMVTMYSVD